MRLMLLALCLGVFAEPSLACRMPRHFAARDMASQPVLIVGRVVQYRFVPNWRERRQHAASKWATLADRKMYLDPGHGFLFDTAQLTITVGHVLKGRAPHRVEIDWAGGNTGVFQTLDRRSRLIALGPGPDFWPTQGATRRSSASRLHLVDVICGGPMMADAFSPVALEVKRLVARKPS